MMNFHIFAESVELFFVECC